MNWTGGASRRSKNAKSSFTMIQKRNFAKAKEKVLNGRKSPYKHDFSMFEPGANFTFNKPKRAGHELGNDHEAQAPLKIHDNETHDMKRPFKSTPRHSVSSGQTSNSSHVRTRATNSSSIKGSKVRGGLVSSYKIPGGHRETSIDRLKLSEADQLEAMAMRQELLSMDDWCGLKRTRPANMHIEETVEQDIIGKRRVVDKTNPSYQGFRPCKRPRMEIDQNDRTEGKPIRFLKRSNPRSVKDTVSPLTRGQDSADLNPDEMLFDEELKNIYQEQNEVIDKQNLEENLQLQSISLPVEGVPGLRLVFDYPPKDTFTPIRNRTATKEVEGTILANETIQKNAAIKEPDIPIPADKIPPKNATIKEPNIPIPTNEAPQKTQENEIPAPKNPSPTPIPPTTHPSPLSKTTPPPLEDEELIWRTFVFAPSSSSPPTADSLNVQASSPPAPKSSSGISTPSHMPAALRFQRPPRYRGGGGGVSAGRVVSVEEEEEEDIED